MAWLKGQATLATIADKLTKLACGEVADDFAVTTALADRWVRIDAGQDAICTPASEKVALPVMTCRAGYFSPASAHHPDASTIRGTWYRLSAVAAAMPAGVARCILQLSCRTQNSVAGNYSTASIHCHLINADTGAAIGADQNVTPSAAGVFTYTNGTFSVQVTCGNAETGLLQQTNQTFQDEFRLNSFFRFFNATYLGGIDFWPMGPKLQPGESSTFTVAPPGVAGTDYDKDVKVPAGFTSGSNTNRAMFINAKGGYGYGLGIKTNTGLGGGALYSVSWNCFGQSIHMSVNGTQYLMAELNGSSGVRADGGGRTRIHGQRITQWMRMFTGAPLSSSVIQYWMCVKADRLIVVLNCDPGVGGVLSIAGTWKFTPADPTNHLFSWAWTGPTNSYQADNSSNGAAYMPCRGVPWVAQVAAKTGDGLPATRDWQTGWMRTDIAMNTYCGDNGSSIVGTSGFDGADNTGGVETDGSADGGEGTGQAYGGHQSPQSTTNTCVPFMGHPGAYGMSAGSGGTLEQSPTFPYTESKPAAGDTRWWLYGHVYTDTPGTGLLNNLKYCGKVTDKFFICPTTGWASGDELLDTVSGKTYFLVNPDYSGQGFGKVRIGTNSFQCGIAIEEAA